MLRGRGAVGSASLRKPDLTHRWSPGENVSAMEWGSLAAAREHGPKTGSRNQRGRLSEGCGRGSCTHSAGGGGRGGRAWVPWDILEWLHTACVAPTPSSPKLSEQRLCSQLGEYRCDTRTVVCLLHRGAHSMRSPSPLPGASLGDQPQPVEETQGVSHSRRRQAQKAALAPNNWVLVFTLREIIDLIPSREPHPAVESAYFTSIRTETCHFRDVQKKAPEAYVGGQVCLLL